MSWHRVISVSRLLNNFIFIMFTTGQHKKQKGKQNNIIKRYEWWVSLVTQKKKGKSKFKG